MSDPLFLLSILCAFLFLMAMGLHIHSILLGIGVLGLVFIQDFSIATAFLRSDPFGQVASYALTTIPLYVIMAQFILKSGVVQDAFVMVYKMSRGKPTVLGSMTVVIGGFLGAVSGSGAATAASLGSVAVPELRSYGFKSDLAGAIAAASGSLSGIIPPSIILILYGVITETPISDLFMAAMIPGVLTMLVFVGCVIVMHRKNPALSGNDLPHSSGVQLGWRRMLTVLAVGIFMFSLIFGGIYLGFVTPTEAGAIGALGAFVTALVLGKVDRSFIASSVRDTAVVTGMIILILIGAAIFGRFVSFSLLPRRILSLIEFLIQYPSIILMILAVAFFLLFMFIEGTAVILMALPVVLPVIEQAQIDVLWFGVFISVICTLGLITPPVGLSVYAAAGTSGVPAGRIFNPATKMAVAVAVVVCGSMIAFPELATWLPSTATR
ncbi:TRAP transporter large permease subunit [Marinobacter sp. 71-i]|uniref:TRAP transporter large permease subunit n=1 Tax=Marinobacter iranensis TaxID=2962607 RepID=A0ABT5Y8W1_9GAMM|nr:TRAP transporter large permease subunit [Marinobacter iranensis]MDF0750107.1 TRAP transporter large permease subunit [Marinobacter iranensis]